MSPKPVAIVPHLLVILLALAPRHALAAWPTQPSLNLPIAVAAGHQMSPVMIADGAGGVIIAWSDPRSGDYDIYAQHVLGSGSVDPAWPASGRALCAAANTQNAPAIASDGAGGAIVTWQDLRGGATYDVYAQHILATGTVDPVWPSNGRAVCTAANHQGFPTPVTDGAGGVVITWYDYRGGAFADIYAQHVLASGAVDPAWPVDGQALCTAASEQAYPKLVADGAGGAVVVWQDFRNGNHDVFAQHVLASGAVDPAWPVDGRALCTAVGNQEESRIVTDGMGGAIVTWFDARVVGGWDIYAQRVLASGAVDPAWSADGRAVCTAAGDQTYADIATDGASGAIITWGDSRSGTNKDIYAQHVLSYGAVDPAWPADGRALCTYASEQQRPAIMADDAGGAIVSWQDRRGGATWDLYAHHVLASGVVDPAWPADGRAICTAAEDQQGQVVISDGAGGAIVAWHDFRSGANWDIYAQRVERFGSLGSPQPELIGVRDVPYDQGGRVQVQWTASYLDVYPSFSIADYSVWRRVPNPPYAVVQSRQAPMSELLSADGRRWRTSIQNATAVYWEYLSSQPARGLSGYSYVALTTSDSTAAANPYTSFMVMAERPGGIPFWSSAPDSGYSVDNLAPATPAPFTGNYANAATHLHWSRNVEVDFSCYRLHRGSSADFVPGVENLIASPPDTGFTDTAPAGGYYKLSAVDIHGNESGFALLGPANTAGVSGPGGAAGQLALAAPWPNPSVRDVALALTLSTEGPIRLAIYDAAGRRVRSVFSGVQAAGEHRFTWNGRDAADHVVTGGLYFLRLEAAGHVLVRRLSRLE